jgi:hypothetical protein
MGSEAEYFKENIMSEYRIKKIYQNYIKTKKSNNSNTKGKFYRDDIEFVKKLDFFNPDPNVPKDFFCSNESTIDIKSHNLLMKKLSLENKIYHNTDNSSRVSTIENLPTIATTKDINSTLDVEFGSILKNNINIKRAENLANENLKENERKELVEEIQKYKSNINDCIIKIDEIQNDIMDKEAELEFLNNFEKYTDNQNIKKYDTLRFNRRNSRTTDVHKAMTQVQRDLDKRQRKIVHLMNSIEKYQISKSKLRDEIQNYKIRIDLLSDRLKEVKYLLMVHYHNLLKEGREARHEGLVWIFKAIWNLDCNIIMSFIPDFLDEKAIDYFFTAAQKDVELQKMKAKIDELKGKIKSSFDNLKFNSRKTSVNKDKVFNASFFATCLEVI